MTGLGLVGLMTVQLLRAQGCRVLGLDFDRHRLELAQRFGAEVADVGAADAIAVGRAASPADAEWTPCLVTASTASSEPLHQAALMCRKRGRIVLVGVAGLEVVTRGLLRERAHVPGVLLVRAGTLRSGLRGAGGRLPDRIRALDRAAQLRGRLGHARGRRIDVGPLISHRFAIDDGEPPMRSSAALSLPSGSCSPIPARKRTARLCSLERWRCRGARQQSRQEAEIRRPLRSV